MNYLTAGRQTGAVDVRITHRIIELFSEGLYSNPHKAVEELVANAFDAGASDVHIILPADLNDKSETIVVIDNGEGMDPQGLRQHWLIGQSNKRDKTFVPPRGRRQIGRFGIGKLATYVLARELTHITKRNGSYFAVTMDYAALPGPSSVAATKPVSLVLRELTAMEARQALSPWLSGSGAAYDAIRLFGKNAANSWTVAVLSNLKDFAGEIRRGRLRWLLSTAMPLRDDFRLFLDGEEIVNPKFGAKLQRTWVLGKDLHELPKPAPDGIEISTDTKVPDGAPTRYGLDVPKLGRVTGYIELYRDPIDTGQSQEISRSNGFFVYVRGRLVNTDDPGFGIDRNKLRHGTFSRFRMVLYADGLDDELRSSRESFRYGPVLAAARNLLHAGFNQARAEADRLGQQNDWDVGERLDAAPLTRQPIAALLEAAFSGKYVPRHLGIPVDADDDTKAQLLAAIRGTEEEPPQHLVRQTLLVSTLSSADPIAVLDLPTRTLKINELHPFVAHFFEDFQEREKTTPLELLAVSEVLLEAQLFQLGASVTTITNTLQRRDLLLRELARSIGQRNAHMIAADLESAILDQNELEVELVSAFDSMGFSAIPLGGSGRPDGMAEAKLGLAADRSSRAYAVSLEAKSKEKAGTKVSAKSVGISTVARHRDKLGCDHAIVVGPDFPSGEDAALANEIAADRNQTGKTITVVRVMDLARLVRLVPLKRVSLTRLRDFFTDCRLPQDAAKWIDRLEAEKRIHAPYQSVLDAIHEESQEHKSEPVEFGSLRTHLRLKRGIMMDDSDLRTLCGSMARLVPEYVRVTEGYVEITTSPTIILSALKGHVGPEITNKSRKN